MRAPDLPLSLHCNGILWIKYDFTKQLLQFGAVVPLNVEKAIKAVLKKYNNVVTTILMGIWKTIIESKGNISLGGNRRRAVAKKNHIKEEGRGQEKKLEEK